MVQGTPSSVTTSPRRFRWRRLLQYSLRTLLILMTACAAAFAWWSNKARQQREAVAAIQWAAHVYYDFQTLHPGTQTWDYYLHEGVVQGSPFGWPKWLVDTLGVDHFANVESVWIPNQSWSDDDFELIKPLAGLRRLGLQGTWTGDAGLDRIKELTSLEFLDLESTTVTDAGLRHLKGFTALRELYVVNTKVTDTGLDHLQGLTALRVLDLRKTKVTDAGVARLQKALPNCKIVR